MTPDPTEARQYGKHVITVDARELELGIVDGAQCWHYFSEDPIPVELLTVLDEKELEIAEHEYNEYMETL